MRLRSLPGSSWNSVWGRLSGSALNILPTGPSIGVKESLLPHTTSSGPLTEGSSWSGGVPGGPVDATMKVTSKHDMQPIESMIEILQ
jgi:hypothetical protein